MADTKKKLAQDACELLAVSMLAAIAYQEGKLSTESPSPETFYSAYLEYLSGRLSEAEMNNGIGKQYVLNLKRHLPNFFGELAAQFPDSKFEFTNVEVEKRNEKKKADFSIKITPSNKTFFVSLKNYEVPKIGRMQVSSGTYNSFVNNFVLIADGVGMYLNPQSGKRFRGSNTAERNKTYIELGLENCVPLLEDLDQLNFDIKRRFVHSPEFEFLDETKLDSARKDIGDRGSTLAFQLLEKFESRNPGCVRNRLLEMIGFDGAEDLLFLANENYIDSINSEIVAELMVKVRDAQTRFNMELRRQSIEFSFSDDAGLILSVNVPFTINKNGAWISEVYEGEKFHKKEGKFLATGQRRPKKSRELATSINTYADLSFLSHML